MITILQKLLPLASTNKITPATENFRIIFKPDRVTVEATDLQTSARSTVAFPSGLDQEIVVNAKLFTDVVKSVKNPKIEIDDKSVIVKSGNSKYKIPLLDPKDALAFPNITKAWTIDIDHRMLEEAIDSTAFAVSKDDLRPALTGIYFDSEYVVSTDAHKLVKYESSINIDSPFIIPVKSAKMLTVLMDNYSIEMSLNPEGNRAVFESAGTVVSCRLIDEKYPDYDVVIPKEMEVSASVNVKELKASLSRLMSVSDNLTELIRFEFSKDSLSLRADDSNRNTEGNEIIGCNLSKGDGMTIGFNGSFVLDCLNSISDEIVQIDLLSPSRAAVIRCEGKVLLIMPVMIQE